MKFHIKESEDEPIIGGVTVLAECNKAVPNAVVMFVSTDGFEGMSRLILCPKCVAALSANHKTGRRYQSALLSGEEAEQLKRGEE